MAEKSVPKLQNKLIQQWIDHTQPHTSTQFFFKKIWVLIKELGFERRIELDVLSRNVELQSSRFVACIEREGFGKQKKKKKHAHVRL
jgi:hypothetical protein